MVVYIKYIGRRQQPTTNENRKMSKYTVEITGIKTSDLPILNNNEMNVWLHPRPGQKLPCDILKNNWFNDAFGELMKDFIYNNNNAIFNSLSSIFI